MNFWPLTSCSLESSVEFYEEKLKPGIEEIGRSGVSLQDLAIQAETLITETFEPDSRSIYRYKSDSTEISVELDKVMLSMVECVEKCGGDSGKRYVAPAIMTCARQARQEDVVAALQFLGTTWLTRFLFVCQSFHRFIVWWRGIKSDSLNSPQLRRMMAKKTRQQEALLELRPRLQTKRQPISLKEWETGRTHSLPMYVDVPLDKICLMTFCSRWYDETITRVS